MKQETSKKAYEEIRPELGKRQAVVYEYIKTSAMYPTNTEISVGLGIPINQITPRTHELRQKGLVITGGKKRCRITKKICLTWRIANGELF
jgi:hypothetical protein